MCIVISQFQLRKNINAGKDLEKKKGRMFIAVFFGCYFLFGTLFSEFSTLNLDFIIREHTCFYRFLKFHKHL